MLSHTGVAMEKALSDLIAAKNKRAFLDRQKVQGKRSYKLMTDAEIIKSLVEAGKEVIASPNNDTIRALRIAIQAAEKGVSCER